jgi:hypothetical protein
MRKIAILSAVTAAAALLLVAPLTASAAPAPAAATTLGNCSGLFVTAIQDAETYTGPDSFTQKGFVDAGARYMCADPGVFLGRRYTACGEVNGNGWINVFGEGGVQGYSPQACFINS